MAQRPKRSISLPADLAAATAAHRLRIEAGRKGLAEWEAENGVLTAAELVSGLTRARAVRGEQLQRGQPDEWALVCWPVDLVTLTWSTSRWWKGLPVGGTGS